MGYYIYIETSSPRILGDKARIMSGPIAANSEYCLEFWYHMFGPDIDALNIYLSSAGTSTVVSVLIFKLDSFILIGRSRL